MDERLVQALLPGTGAGSVGGCHTKSLASSSSLILVS